MEINVDKLIENQFLESEYFKHTFENLKSVKRREIFFDGFSYVLQFNPARIRSATAKTDVKVDSNACFLCPGSRFEGQIGMEYNKDYELFLNPFPIFSRHFTIVDKKHTPQSFTGQERVFLQMAIDLHGLIVFYNAPKCGASAPFHRHFQAGSVDEMPVFHQTELLKSRYSVDCFKGNSVEINKIYDTTRRFIIIEADNIDNATSALIKVENNIKKAYNVEEAEANIGAFYGDNGFLITVFPREKHRPEQYFLLPPEKITVSPGFADMAGIIPCAVESEFNKISSEDISSIFNQVTSTDENFSLIEN